MEEHKVVKVKVSPKQLSRMRNGHKVRVKKPEMEGEGVCVVVDPANYSLVTRSFSRNKGLELSLSPPEILANKEASATMSGQGIFGKKFDKFAKKVLGKKGKNIVYGIAKQFLPVAQAAVDVGVGGLTTLVPQLAPLTPMLSGVGKDYLANPSKYQGGKGKKTKIDLGLARDYLQSQTQDLQSQLQSQILSSRDKALADLQARAEEQRVAAAAAAAARTAPAPATYEDVLSRGFSQLSAGFGGQGLYAGSGLYAGASGRGTSIVGMRGGMLHTTPPALQSQPYGANFQFKHTLPPAYQKYII